VRIRIVAAYEILAGLVGLVTGVRPSSFASGGAVKFNIFVVALASASILLGLFTWTRHEQARRLTLAFQILQVPRLTSSTLVLGFLVGVEGTARFQGPLLSLYTTFGVSAIVLRPAAAQPTVIGINLIAAVMAGLAWSRAAITTPEPATAHCAKLVSDGRPPSERAG
jgi:hypothetical protein